MPHISNRKIEEKMFLQMQEVFFDALLKTQTKRETRKILKELLTRTEAIMLIKRFALIYFLAGKCNWEKIEEALGMSSSTIARMALAIENGKYSAISNRIKQSEKEKTFIGALEKFLFILPPRVGRERFDRLMDN